MQQPALEEKYFAMLKGYVSSREEAVLMSAAELGREMVLADIPPEEVSELHEKALRQLAQDSPHLRLGDVAQSISAPFMEMSVAYGLAFRERLEARQLAQEELRKLNEELEQRVLQRTAELESANEELESFSYSVSHDLRAPLRALGGFSRILMEQYAPELPPEAQHYLHLVRENTEMMGTLIDDLLAFSRLGRQDLKKQPVEPAVIVKRVLEDLRSEQEGRRVDVSIGDLPPCQADAALLTQVYLNLIGNALKYTRRNEAAAIEVGCQQVGGEHVYYVKDNGAGFDMRYYDKLFGVFQRLHRSTDYEGTGVGLAIVRRIINRHGGRVWAEAEVDKGASFYFTLAGGAPDGTAV